MELGSERPLVLSDMYPLMPDCESASINALFDAAWTRELAANPTEPSLVRVLRELYGTRFWLAGLFKVRLCSTLFDFETIWSRLSLVSFSRREVL